MRFRLSGMGQNRYWVGPKGKNLPFLQVKGELDYRLVEPLEGNYPLVGYRGQMQLERQSIADLRLEKSFSVRGHRLAATLDVFNIFRCEAITRKNNLINHAPFHWRMNPGEDWGGVQDRDRFGAPLDRVSPQTLRMGLVAYFQRPGGGREPFSSTCHREISDLHLP